MFFRLMTGTALRDTYEVKQFAEYGASIEYLPYTIGISTSNIKNKRNIN